MSVSRPLTDAGLYYTVTGYGRSAIFVALHTYTCTKIIQYDTRCYFNVQLKADMSQFNLPHGTNN